MGIKRTNLLLFLLKDLNATDNTVEERFRSLSAKRKQQDTVVNKREQKNVRFLERLFGRIKNGHTGRFPLSVTEHFGTLPPVYF